MIPLAGAVGKLRAGRSAERLYAEGMKLYVKLDLRAAEPKFRDALDAAKTAGGLGQIAKVAEHLYMVLERQRRYRDAMPILELKVDCDRSMNGLDGDRTFDWRQELIWLCGRLEDYVKVEPICREQLEATIRRFKPGPFRAFALVTLAWSIRMQGRLDEAAELYREALAMLEETEQREDPRTGWPLLGLAAIAEQQGDIETAEECLRRAWGNWNRVGRVGMANRTRDKLIDLYIDNGRVNDGLTLAHATLETLQRFSRDAFEDRERRLHDTERLARLYTAANRPEDARRMETRARYLREDIERERMEKAQTVQRFGDQTGADQPLNRKDEFAGPVFFHVGEII